jgi:N-acyl-D-aspartate/D-glutamate deacylase
MLADEGKGILYMAFLNYANGDLEPSYEMMKHPHTVMGLADGGAHVGLICDASFPTTMLTHWTRDRTRGEKLSIEFAVKCYTKDSAEAVGLFDRGILADGYKADINIIDYEKLSLHSPTIVFDLPAGGKRLDQLADGYVATIVNGLVTYKNGQPTGALPGRLIRGAKKPPSAKSVNL